MGKGKFTSLDVCAMVKELRPLLIGMRLDNVYDVSAKEYLLKFHRPNQKVFVLLESGMRFHLTKYSREKSQLPNQFATKLRKHIRKRRLEDIKQLGIDRVVVFTFGTDERAFHLILEMYSGGNILLTNHDYHIFALLRSHEGRPGEARVMVGETYPMNSFRVRPDAIQRNDLLMAVRDLLHSDYERREKEKRQAATEGDQPGGGVMQYKGKRRKRKKMNTESALSTLLVRVLGAGPQLVDHSLTSVGVKPSTPLREFLFPESTPETKFSDPSSVAESKSGDGNDNPNVDDDIPVDDEDDTSALDDGGPVNEHNLNTIVEALANCLSVMNEVEKDPMEGYIITRPSKPQPKRGNDTSEAKEEQKDVYVEFLPYRFDSVADKPTKTFPSFAAAVDEFFSIAESQKEMLGTQKQERAAWKKIDRVRAENLERIQKLESRQETDQRLAEVIELNLELVDAAISAVNEKLRLGMDWNELRRFIDHQAQLGNPVAAALHQLKIDRRTVTMRLSKSPKLDESDDDDDDDDDSEDEDDDEKEDDEDEDEDEELLVDIDLDITAFANARVYYERKRNARNKQMKTEAASSKALKAAEKRTERALKEVKQTMGIQKLREVYWWEKFFWFVSSENYLVFAGRDGQQIELIFKSYMDRNRDVLVNCDRKGATPFVIKNPTGEPIPPTTLAQAGNMCVCRSSAWDDKVVLSAYWVHANQITRPSHSKKPGVFSVRGNKTFLPPQPLILGYGIVFKVDAASAAKNHREERRPKAGTLSDGAELVTKYQLEPSTSSNGDDSAVASSNAVSHATSPSIPSASEASPQQASNSADPSTSQPSSSPSNGGTDTSNPPASSNAPASSDPSASSSLPASTDPPASPKMNPNSALSPPRESQSPETLAPPRTTESRSSSSSDVDPDAQAPSSSDPIDMASSFLSKSQSSSPPATSSDEKSSAQGSRQGKRPLSKAERRRLKRAAQGLPPPSSESPSLSRASSSASSTQAKKKGPVPVVLPRGKKAKLKKMKKKYAAQDDEDRRLALEILGAKEMKLSPGNGETENDETADGNDDTASEQSSVAPRQRDYGQDLSAFTAEERRRQQQEADRKAEETRKLDEERRLQQNNTRTCFQCGQIGHVKSNCPLAQNAAVLLQGGANGHMNGSGEDDGDDGDDKEGPALESLSDKLDFLTGKPQPDDVIEFPVPMCAPYDVLKDFAYKVKVMPGTVKRGKAVKAALGLFLRMNPEAPEVEKTAIKSVPDPEAIASIVTGVKISAPGVAGDKKGGGGGRGHRGSKHKSGGGGGGGGGKQKKGGGGKGGKKKGKK